MEGLNERQLRKRKHLINNNSKNPTWNKEKKQRREEMKTR
jgi:hypothetical protein